MPVEEQIKSFLETNFLFEFDGEITGDTDLFRAGIVDSFGYVQLVGFLKTTFHITFTDEELLTNILVSLNQILTFVQAKQALLDRVGRA